MVSKASSQSLEARTRRLVIARRQATAFLGAVTLVFIGVTVYGAHGTALGYVQAGAEAGMVGGIADWFAVTALFRHPLGIPIPHTALIVERKDQFAATLGQFVQENFLNGDVLAERIAAARISSRIADWVTDEANAARIAGHIADLLVRATGTFRDEDVQGLLAAELTKIVDSVDVASVAGRVLRTVIAGGHQAEVFDSFVTAADGYLESHYDDLRERFEVEAPRWLPDMVYGKVFDRIYSNLRGRLQAMVGNPDDDARRQFDTWLYSLPARLETEPAMRERAERVKQEVIGSATVRDWSSAIWENVKKSLQAQAADPGSGLRRRIAETLMASGRRLESDTRLQASLEHVAENAVRGLADQFHDELAGLVTGTIQRWDANQTSTQLELLLGRDLQFIRINGTVVGAGIGLILHVIALI